MLLFFLFFFTEIHTDHFFFGPIILYTFYSVAGILLSIHKCFKKVHMTNIRLSKKDFDRITPSCKPYNGTKYSLIKKNEEWHCDPYMTQGNITFPNYNGNGSSIENAVNIMNNLADLVEMMQSYTAFFTIGNIKGAITKLPRTNPTNIIFGITTKRDMNIHHNTTDLSTDFSQLVCFPKDASDMAIKKNGTFAAVLLFPGVHQDQDPNSDILNNEMMGIDMGAEISNLSHTIDIHYKNVTKNGLTASCRSWDGKGKEQNWVTDGCETRETDDGILCHCSHLTFFAVLMSPPPQNISASDFTALTYITSIGCGLSMLFLAVGLFMHCLLRKGKASQSTKVLINLFVAMFNLNLSFLINKTIADLGNLGACVAMAAFMHYTLLATFTWFFMVALHVYFNLRKIPTEVKHYMMKICVAGWVTPSVVVIALAASGKYDYLILSVNDGNSARMCWISDAVLHKWVNISYYGVVFIFTITIFIITVWQIIVLKPTAVKSPDGSTTAYSFSIVSLFVQLGITWAFAFFSHGPMVIASYYIFTILNSFQGLFLFIYYYCSSRTSEQDRSSTVSSSSTATSNTVITSPYQ
ncbi:adhesion G-protein coupled receptor G2 isoform X1 [Larimichthys crocea]|uniref:adhesion G-protein coupled receptor G2 isoform X1 n=1 Tax=Larimichthys crocea TaxID=215358 RepID=UPI000F5EA105|nr:adhesion G-protein coupled receptor G2 isoform X1 [Larimichthys crocea]